MAIRLLTASGPVTDQSARAIKELVNLCHKVLGVAPISEQPLLWLQDSRASVTHVLALDDNRLVGYGQVDHSSELNGSLELDVSLEREASFEYALHPALGDEYDATELRLLEAGNLIAQQHQADFSVWLHGPTQDQMEFFAHNGFETVRSLERRALTIAGADLPALTPPTMSPFHIRTFVRGLDDERWVSANSKAFVDHPEQGRLTVEDLRSRMLEPWFDTELFFVIDSDDRRGQLDAYAWVKAIEGSSSGELYVLGTVPEARGRGLGKELLLKAIAAIELRGYQYVDLYVDSSNKVAVNLYESLGFSRVEHHLKVKRPFTR